MNLKRIIREEMDNSLGWINDIKPALNQEQNWIIVNDVNPSDIKEGIKIQKYLFDLGYKWFSSEIIMDTIYSIHHFPNKGLRGDLTYYNNKENEKDLADKEIERNNNVYYWSQLKPDSLNESNDLDWIKDVEAGDLWTPYVGMKFIVTDGSDDVIYHILDINDEDGWMELKWENNKTGEEEYFGYYMEDYYRMVEEDRVQIVHDKLNESEGDLDWIKDINPIPELKVGSCFTDVMDPTQRKWVIIDFILTPAGTRTVIVKNNIDINYMNLEYFEQDLFSGRYKPCQR